MSARHHRRGLGRAAGLLLLPFGLPAAGVLAGWPQPAGVDARVTVWAVDVVDRLPWLMTVLVWVSGLTQPFVLRLAAVAGAVLAWRRGRRRLGIWLVGVVGTGSLLAVAIKIAVARDRPGEALTLVGGYSFPSSHALHAALAAGIGLVLSRPLLPRLGRAARAVRIAVATGYVLAVGADRVLLAVHNVSDVVAGWALGGAVVLVWTAAYPPWRPDAGPVGADAGPVGADAGPRTADGEPEPDPAAAGR